MADRKLSKRSQRRLRSQLAHRLVDEQIQSEPQLQRKKARQGTSDELGDEEELRGGGCLPQGEPCGAEELGNDGDLESDDAIDELGGDGGLDSEAQLSGGLETSDELGSDGDLESDDAIDKVGGEGCLDSDDRLRGSLESSDELGGSLEGDDELGSGGSMESGLSGDELGSGGSMESGLSSDELGGGGVQSEVSDDDLNEGENTTERLQAIAVPLFPESKITSVDFNIAFMSLIQRHNLTYCSQTDVLKLLSIMLPTPNDVPSSAHTLTSKFANIKTETVVREFCGTCTCSLIRGCACAKQPCIAAKAQRAIFVRVPLSMQLRERFEDPDFADLIQYRFHREKKPGVLADIYDGSEYLKFSDFFEHRYNLSFAFNFDGAPRFKSSSVQIWPIQLYLNELPPHIRSSREHMFLAGIWCSAKKPPISECLTPIIEELQALATEGVKVTVKGCEVTCKARLLFAVTDLPAKAALFNITQFNGKFGCPACKHEGEQVAIGRGRARAYGYRQTAMRNKTEHLEHAVEAESTNEVVYGVKGRSVLHALEDFDVISSDPVDYMHCVLLGVVRTFVSLWFESKHHREQWYIGNKVVEADARLLGIKPPNSVVRIPRSFRGRAWKATECRTFLLYYLPTLHGILPDKYLAHALLLSKAIRLLLADQISFAEIEVADNLLQLFWRLTEKYYGLKHCKVNVHLLSHLPHYVKIFGPLWTHSAFAFEDNIGHLVKKSHGTHDIANQIVTSFLLQWRLHVLRKNVQGPVELTAFLNNLTPGLRSTERKLTECISALGSPRNITLQRKDEALVRHLLCENNIDSLPSDIVTLQSKLIIRGQVIYSKQSKRVKKRNNYTVAFSDPKAPSRLNYGRVEKFLTCPADHPNCVHLAILERLKVQSCAELLLNYPPELQCLAPVLCSDYISVVSECEERVAVPVEHIVMKCFDISTVAFSGITVLVNECEVAK